MMTSRPYAWLCAACALALLAPRARADYKQLSFETRFATAPNTPAELAPLPTVGLAPSPAVISAELAEQLRERVEQQLREQPDGAQFQVLTRTDPSGVRWVLATLSQPRAGYAALADSFTAQLFDCLHTLSETSPEFGEYVGLLAGSALTDASRPTVASASASMLRAWRESKCTVRRNASALLERQRARIGAALYGMLTGEFDALLFRGQNLLDLIAQLSVLVFDRQGFFRVEREARLTAVLKAALGSGGYLDAKRDAHVLDDEFESFWSWTLSASQAQPDLGPRVLDTVANSCAASIQRLSQPFRLRGCADTRALLLYELRIADVSVLVPEKGVAP